MLLGAVIAGVLAMHILSEPDGLDGHSMPAGMVVNPEMAAASNMPGMGMGAGRADPKAAAQPAATAVSATMTASDSSGMAAMTCCTLFLLTVAGLLLMLLLRAIRRRPATHLTSSALQRFSQRRRGPPIVSAPRILLCVLRV